MKFGIYSLVLGSILVASLTVRAESKPTPANDEKADKLVTCTGSAGPRKLIVAKKEKGCELQYLKGEKTDVVATQKMGSNFCEEKLAKIQAKLEAAGYKCE